MKHISFAKNPEAFARLDRWYNRFLARLPFAPDQRSVESRFGTTEALVTGPPTSEPIVLLHGALAGAPHALGELGTLPTRRRIYALNIPGQSPRAPQVRLNFGSDEWALWFADCLDSLGLESAYLCGVSWGGGVALQVAKHFPERVRGMVLLVPAAIVRGSAWRAFWEIGLPMLVYKIFPSESRRKRAFRGILTNEDDLWTPYVDEATRDARLNFSAPPLIKPHELTHFNAPVYVIAADRDLQFPGEKLLHRADALFSNLVGTHLLNNSRHAPSFHPEDRARFAAMFEAALDTLGVDETR